MALAAEGTGLLTWKALRSPAMAMPSDQAHPVVEAGHPVPDEAGEARCARDSPTRETPEKDRSTAGAPFRRRLEPAVAARRGNLDGGSQGGDDAAPAQRRHHPGDQYRAQAPLSHSRRQARRGFAARRSWRSSSPMSPATIPRISLPGRARPDPTTCDDARSVLAKYRIAFPAAYRKPPSQASRFRRVENRVIATPHRSLEAAQKCLRNGTSSP